MFTETFIFPLFAGLVVSCFGVIFQRSMSVGSRVTILETHQEDLPELITSKFETVSSKFDDVSRRLDRIERAMNGSLRGY